MLGSAALTLGRFAAGGGPTKDECIDANELAQRLVKGKKLRAARERLLVCVASSCPTMIRDDCVNRLTEVESSLPTIVFEAQDPDGIDVSAVQVELDGAPLADKLDGTSLAVDPGEHVFVFKVAGQAPTTRQLVLHEGEKARREHIIVGGTGTSSRAASARPVEASPQTPPSVSPEDAGEARKPWAVVLIGAGGAGLAVGSIFGLLTISSWKASQRECSSASLCPNPTQAVTDHDVASMDGTISTIGFIVGGALMAGGAALWLTAPSPRRVSKHPPAIHVSASVGPQKAGLIMTGAF
jgi:hypothetical protein